jgi:hypothetical protein
MGSPSRFGFISNESMWKVGRRGIKGSSTISVSENLFTQSFLRPFQH